VSRAARIQLAVGMVLVVMGVLFATLPKDWIEETLGFEPDAGNGSFELLIVLVPLVLGVALIARALVVWRKSAPAAVPPSPEQL
jgi:apolipoprotein N-acyltransferase